MSARTERDEREEVLIAGLLQEPKRLVELKGFDRSWLHSRECRAIFAAMRQHHEENAAEGRVRYARAETVERVVQERYGRSSGDARIDKARRALRKGVASLLDKLREHPRVDEHAFLAALDGVSEAGLETKAKEVLLSLVDRYETGGVKNLHRALQEAASAVTPGGADAMARPVSESASNVLVTYGKAKKMEGGGYIPTPFPILNKLTNGGKRGRFWLVPGFAKDGKTQLSKELVYHAAVACGLGCVVFSGEQTAEEMDTMLVVRHSHKFIDGGVSAIRLDAGKLKESEEAAMRETVRDLREGNYGPTRCVRASLGMSIADVRASLEVISKRQPVDVVMLDHTALFGPSRRVGGDASDTARLSATLQEMKQLALDFQEKGVWLIAPHQIKREGYEKAQERGYYIATDAAGSAEAERSCDVMLWVLRTAELRDVSEVRLGIALDRRGPGHTKGWEEMERYEACAILPMAEGGA